MDKLDDNRLQALEAICPGGVFKDVCLAELSQWKVGGIADVIIRPKTIDQLIALRKWFFSNSVRHIVIGATTNLLFDDAGLKVPCIQLGSQLSNVAIEGDFITAEAGVWVPALARAIMKASLTGAEHTCGIPGTLGGLICMNGGSQRKGIGSNIVKVISVAENGAVFERNAEECRFGYRESIFQYNSEIVTAATLRFSQGDRSNIRREMLNILKDRNKKFPRKEPNCGSVFKSNPEMYQKVGPPGAVIERIGLKGYEIGGAKVSDFHANFIVNNGSAKSNDLLELIRHVKNKVCEKTGYNMAVEVLHVKVNGCIVSL